MKHDIPVRRDPYKILNWALSEGWNTVDTMPLRGDGPFLVVTLSGLVRLARSRQTQRRSKPADGWGPERIVVTSVETGNYIAAIAWRWRDETPKG